MILSSILESIGLGFLIVVTVLLTIFILLIKKVITTVITARNRIKDLTIGDVIDGTKATGKAVGKRVYKNVRNTKIFK